MTSSIFDRTSYLLRKGVYSDIKIVTGRDCNKKSFDVHKLFLAMASDVFAAMFYGSLAENKSEIELPDEDADTFEAVLNYVYSDLWELSSVSRALQVYRFAEIYNMPHLKEQCRRFIKDSIHSTVSCAVYDMASLLRDDDLKEISWQMIIQETNEALQSDDFLTITPGSLKDIVQHDSLNISEIELFQAIMRWTWFQCERLCEQQHREMDDVTSHSTLRDLTDEILPYIRFLAMTPEQFTNGPAKSGILTSDESFAILATIVNPGSTMLPAWCSTDKTPRSSGTSQESENAQTLITTRCTNWFSITENLRPIRAKFKTRHRDVHLLGGSFFLQSRSSRYNTVSFDFKVTIGEDPERLVSVVQYEDYCISGRANHRLMLSQSVYLTEGDVCSMMIVFKKGEEPSWNFVQCVGSLVPGVSSVDGTEFQMYPVDNGESHFHEIYLSLA